MQAAQAVQLPREYEEVYERKFRECMELCARSLAFCLAYCDFSARLEAAEQVLGPEAAEKVRREAFVWR